MIVRLNKKLFNMILKKFFENLRNNIKTIKEYKRILGNNYKKHVFPK